MVTTYPWTGAATKKKYPWSGAATPATPAAPTTPTQTTEAQPSTVFGSNLIGMPLGGGIGTQVSIQTAQAAKAVQEQIPAEGLYVIEGIKVMPNLKVYADDNPTNPIGQYNLQTGEFQEIEPSWWEKVGRIVQWLPPNIPATLLKKYGASTIQKADLPFMIGVQAETLKGKTDLTQAESDFLNLYKKEVGEPPTYNKILAALHPAATVAQLWKGAALKPSEELKKAYYDSVGIGTTIWQGLTTPLSVALFIAGGLGGATAAEARLAQQAAKGGVAGKIAQVGQIAAAPLAGIEWAMNQIFRYTIGQFPRLVGEVSEAIAKRNFNASSGARRLATMWGEDSAQYNAMYKVWRLNMKKPPVGQATDFYAKQALKEFEYWYSGDKVFREGIDSISKVATGAAQPAPTTAIPALPSGITPTMATTGAFGGTVTGIAPTVTGITAGVEFRPITTNVGKGYEILQNGERVGRISYTADFPGVEGIVIDRIDIVETARRQGLATQAIDKVLSEAEASGVPLYTGLLEPDGVKLFNGLENQGVVKLTPAKERMLGDIVTRGVPEYAPTTAMAEWGTISGNIDEMEAELAGLKESLSTEPGAKLVDLVKKIGEYKGEITNFTLKQYRDITGKREIEPSILTKDKKHVRWEYALDEIAEDMGYESEEALKKAIEQAVRVRARIKALQSAIARTEVTPEVTGGIVPPEAAVSPTGEIPQIAEIPPAVPTVSEGKLRQNIMATVKTKGLRESKYRALFKQVGGTRNLTEMGTDKLQKVLEAVQETRPVKIGGKNVITAKTEKAIQTLKDVLIREKKLTPEMYEDIKKSLDLATDKYESKDSFITERQGYSLIRQMNAEAEVGLTKWDVLVSEGLAKKPELRTAIDKLSKRIITENKPKPKKGITIPFRQVASEISEYPNDVGLSGTMSVLRALRRFQEQLGGREVTRIYDVAEMMVEQRRLNDVTLANTINAIRLKVPQLATIIQDKNKMDRIQRWLDADLKIANIKKPDLTPDELAVAQLFRERYDQWKNVVRLERFKDAYFHYGGRARESVAELIKNGTEGTSDVAIPDAPIKDIKEAIEIYEAQGETGLKAYLDTKDWGVIKSGYSFSQILHPQLRMYRRVAVRATTTSLHQRKGLEFLRDEKTAWERLIAYERQMIGLNLQSYFRKMDSEFRKIVESGKISPENADDAAKKISLFMREVKGYPIESPVVALMLRMAGWAFGTLSKVPWMSVRNIHQNIAFHPDKSEILKSFFGRGFFSNPLTKRGRLDYTDALVHQYKGVQQEQILMGYMGRTPIENLIRRTDYYHLSDKANRYMSMNGSGAKAERALQAYLRDKDIAKFLKDSGANELSATEQVRILEYLALENYDYNGVLNAVSGSEAAIRDIANRITTLNHFNYVRYLRSSVEMGEIGRIAGSLVAFPRSVAEKYVDIFSRVKRLSGADRKRGIHALIAIIVGSVIASEMLKQITGKERDAYNPLLIMQWQVGGLATGVIENIQELYRLITNLTFAEDEGQKKYYFDELVLLIPSLGDSFIPFYSVTMNLLESLTDSQYLDRKWLRQIRELIDKNYELNDEFYQIERDWIEKVQHGLFGSNTPSPSDLEQALKSLQGIEDNLGQADEEGEIYTTSKLGSDIDSAVRNLDPTEVITENGFSDLVLARLDYQVIRDKYFEIDADKRYDYRAENPNVDANLFFWSYVVTLQSNEAKRIVQAMISDFNIPTSAIRGYDNVFGQAEGQYPWSGATGGETETPWTSGETKTYPWTGAASK
jgi:hypothetical protein